MLVCLEGDARARGQGQRQAQGFEQAKALFAERARGLETQIKRNFTLLCHSFEYCQCHLEEEMQELSGLADSLGTQAFNLYAALCHGVLADLDAVSREKDGCSTFAIKLSSGLYMGKNRDFLGRDQNVQRVFLQSDNATAQKKILAVGSLAAPGAYSSGINLAGLTVVDTAISTTDHGPGALRYLVMTRLLWRYDTLEAALAYLGSLQHIGGGSLILGDRHGNIAAVDLGHTNIRIERGSGWLARTNHFCAGSIAAGRAKTAMRASSTSRLDHLHAQLPHIEDAAGLWALLSSHDAGVCEGLCRHGQDGEALTLSGALFEPAKRKVTISDGLPCHAKKFDFKLEG